jgi:hypothetical protein
LVDGGAGTFTIRTAVHPRGDLGGERRELAIALRSLQQIRSLVAKDPDIQGGDPVFNGEPLKSN